MEEYEKAVKDFADSKKNFQFTNEGIAHAAIVVTNLIRTTESILRIYSGCLHKDVANNKYLVSSLKVFLEKGRNINLILDYLPEEDEQSEALKQIINLEKNVLNNVKIKIDNNQKFSNSVATIFTDNLPHHFIVSDNLAYRFEVDAQNYKAICNFNNKEVAEVLIKTFDEYFNEL